MVTTGTTSFHI